MGEWELWKSFEVMIMILIWWWERKMNHLVKIKEMNNKRIIEITSFLSIIWIIIEIRSRFSIFPTSPSWHREIPFYFWIICFSWIWMYKSSLKYFIWFLIIFLYFLNSHIWNFITINQHDLSYFSPISW